MGKSIETKVLHICNWYPNNFDPIEGHFIKEQIDALNRFVPSDVIVLQIRYGKFKVLNYLASQREKICIIQMPLKSWFVKEIFSSLLLWFFLLFTYDASKYSIVNFHIAYPLLTYFYFFKKRFKVPVIISEHWSAYHFNFGVKKDLKRIKNIFAHQLPVITVSRSLANDIARFSGQSLTAFQVPNVVHQSFFEHSETKPGDEPGFFMLGCWQFPKVPWIVLEALYQLRLEGYRFKLRIGGYGPYEDELRSKIASLGMEPYALFIGKLSFEEAATEMRNTSFFVHASNYETFSLVCAEALCCGIPVIASEVGGIPEYLHAGNGILVKENNVRCWNEALKASYHARFNRELIVAEADKLFSASKIGERYKNILDQINKSGR